MTYLCHGQFGNPVYFYCKKSEKFWREKCFLVTFDEFFLVGPNQRTTRGDRPIHLAARSSSFQVLEFFKTLPEYAQMKESRNVEGHRPIDIVNEKEDTEVKSKLLGNGSLFRAIVHSEMRRRAR